MADDMEKQPAEGGKAAKRSARLAEVQKEIDALVAERECLLQGKDYVAKAE